MSLGKHISLNHTGHINSCMSLRFYAGVSVRNILAIARLLVLLPAFKRIVLGRNSPH